MPTLKPIHSINVRHNIEIAHRLSQLPGKCQNIHGHGMQVNLTLTGQVNPAGILGGLDFHAIKKTFRGYLDRNWDHHLHLNQDDPILKWSAPTDDGPLPGVVRWPGDPTTENIALWIWTWCVKMYKIDGIDLISIDVDETRVNGAAVT